jgi:hypothetical protein
MVVIFMILPAGQTIKARANSLTQRRGEDEASGRTRPKHTKHLDFQPHNPLKSSLKVRVKNLIIKKIIFCA